MKLTAPKIAPARLKTPTFGRTRHHVGAQPAPVVEPKRRMSAGLPSRKRSRNAAVMAAGAALIVVAGALGASVAASYDDTIDVLVAATDIIEGQTVDTGDFRVVQIAAGQGEIAVVSPMSAPDLAGRVAAGPIAANAMIHPSQFVDPTAETQVVVGAAVKPQQYPAGGLRPGDLVRVVQTADRSQSDEIGRSELATGEIVDVVPLSNSSLHVSIRVSESIAPIVALRAAEDDLIFTLLDESRVPEQVDPLRPAQPVVPLELNAEATE